MKILIIPDIHLRYNRVEEQINKVAPDKIIFLGDYFDNFGDTVEDNVKTADWLIWSLSQPNRIHLLGNHDIHYWNRCFACSGYSSVKHLGIDTRMEPKYWDALKLFHIEGGILFTHAGLSYHLFNSSKDASHVSIKESEVTIDKIKDFLETEGLKTRASIFNGKRSLLTAPGLDRGGGAKTGGVIWCDFNSFCPIPGIRQVFGHTIQSEPRVAFLTKDSTTNPKRINAREAYQFKKRIGTSFCLDTSNQHYAILEDGRIFIFAWENGNPDLIFHEN